MSHSGVNLVLGTASDLPVMPLKMATMVYIIIIEKGVLI